MPSKTFKDSLARRFINDLRVLWFVSPTKAAVMKTCVHPYELGHTQGPDFFLCSRSLSSLFVPVLTVKLTPIYLGQIPRFEWSTAYPRSCKGLPFQGSDNRVKENSYNWWQFRKPVRIPSTDVSCQALHCGEFYKMQPCWWWCSVVVCFWQVVSL